MLELSKNILEKVSFDRNLFFKELRKALEWINEDELTKFKTWCLNKFGRLYHSEIELVFVQRSIK